MATISYASDIEPVLKQYLGPMLWRFDLTSYEDVKQNASIIQERISSSDPGERMPPPPFPPVDPSFVDLFNQWVADHCPP